MVSVIANEIQSKQYSGHEIRRDVHFQLCWSSEYENNSRVAERKKIKCDKLTKYGRLNCPFGEVEKKNPVVSHQTATAGNC